MVAATASGLVIAASSVKVGVEFKGLRLKDPNTATSGILVPRSFVNEAYIGATPTTVVAATVKGFNVVFFTTGGVAGSEVPGVGSKELVYSTIFSVYSGDSGGSPIPTIPPVGFNAYVGVVIRRVPMVGPPVANTRVWFADFPTYVEWGTDDRGTAGGIVANAATDTSLRPLYVFVPEDTSPAGTTNTTSAPGVGYKSMRGGTGGVVKGASPCDPWATNGPTV